ncbi:MAG: prepilin-type N-terminal cleavage/methylation domain-containing protein [Verrucomicrobiota bacterium]
MKNSKIWPRPEPDLHSSAFTLVELLVVIGIIALLSALLLPGMAGTKADSWRTQCQAQMKQLCVGFNLFANDHSDQYPPAGWDNGTSSAQAAWDGYIHPYIGGKYPQADMSYGSIPIELTPRAERCPTDILPSGWPADWAGRRSYAMIPPGGWNVGVQVGVTQYRYKLPSLANLSGPCGVGIYWRVSDSTSVDWDAKGYRTTAVPDPAGLGLLVEQPFNNNAAGNFWTCFSYGPRTSMVPGEGWQLCGSPAPESGVFGVGSPAVNYGLYTYKLHGTRFNYLFHDGHVAPLTVEQSAGTGSLAVVSGNTKAKGLWTANPGD